MIITILKILLLIACFFCCFGLFYSVSLIICKVPSKKHHKAMMQIYDEHINRKSRGLNEINHALAELLSQILYINPYKRSIIESKLSVAHIPDTTPEIYTAENLVLLLECLIIALITWSLVPFLAIVVAVVGIYGYFRQRGRLDRALKNVQREIDIDLPRFVYAVKEEYKLTSNVVDLLEKHKGDYTEYWEREMNITIADMKSGNYEIALKRLDNRVGSSNLSEVTRGLIEMCKGNDTQTYWEALEIRFSEYRKQELMQQVEKIPDKVHNLSLWLILCVLALYMVTFGTVLFNSMSEFGW